MVKTLCIVAIVATAAVFPATIAIGKRHHGGHGHGHGHRGGHGHGGGHGGGHGHGHGHGHGYGFGIHIDHGHGHHHHDSSWYFAAPWYDRAYLDSYYFGRETDYYAPRTYAYAPAVYDIDPESYLAAQPVQIESSGDTHEDYLAERLERLANLLCLDLHYNYRHNPDFAETYRAAYEIFDMAKSIHAIEHQGDREEVARRLEEVDEVFNLAQNQIQTWSRRHYRQFGQADAQAKLELIEATLHQLMNDFGAERYDDAQATASGPLDAETAPPPEPAASNDVPLPPPAAR